MKLSLVKYFVKSENWLFCILLSSVFLITTEAAAQQQPNGDLNRRIIPQAPNVSSLLKFNEVPVNYFNGTADISIPLMEVGENQTNIPLMMRYHTGGIKVTEESSWVGLGWDLQVAGIIQEIIVGEPDYESDNKTYAGDYNRAPKPYNSTTFAVYSTPQASNLMESGFCYLDENNQVKGFQQDDVYKKNFEYDLYSYSFGGYSGKFVFLDNINGTTLDRQNIVFKTSTNKNDLTTSLTATTPDGTQYIFATVGLTITPRVCSSPEEQQPIKSRTWYLTKIVNPDKTEVTFTYYPKRESRTLPSFDQTWIRTEKPPGYNISQPIDYRSTSINYSTVESFYLQEINFPLGRLSFIVSDRQDMENALKLDKIQLFAYPNFVSAIREVNFSYGYFEATTSSDDWNVYVNTMVTEVGCKNYYTPNSNFISKRLKLTSLQISDPVNTQLALPYSFEYSSFPLPKKTSLAQDLWGFNNGVYSNTTLLPNYNNLGYWDGNLPSYFLVTDPTTNSVANRSANFNAQGGILTKVTYPTKGYSTFAYEPNSVKQQGVSILTNQTVEAVNLSSGIHQVEFDIPDIGYGMNLFIGGIMQYRSANPVNIAIKLNCCPNPPPNGCASSGFCGPYNSSSPTFGLYTILERLSNGQWVRTNPGERVYDFSTIGTTSGSNYSEYAFSTGLVPGRYRLTANYPDNAPSQGGIGSNLNQARITVTYKQAQSTFPPPMVAGMRVSSITEYNYNGDVALQRKFAYTGGQMMTKPLFYRQFQYVNFATSNSANCSANDINNNIIGNTCPTGTQCPDLSCTCPYVDNISKYYLYSNPVANYSYSANGGLVGYDMVTVTYDGTGSNGKTEYVYNNNPDFLNVNSVLPGIPSSPDFLTGTLKSITEYRKENTTFVPVKSKQFEYALSGFEMRWCLKTEYNPRLVVYYEQVASTLVPKGLAPNGRSEPKAYYVHFYPLKFGKMNRVKSTETLFEGNDTFTTEENYQYNSKQQLFKVTRFDSQNRTHITETYYPSDYTTTTDFTKEMRDRNMVDYPVETISLLDGQVKNAAFNEYYVHDNMVSPLTISKYNASTPGSFTRSVPSNIKDGRYVSEIEFTFNPSGTLRQQRLKNNNTNKVYIWGYNNVYPVAEITNASYDEVKSALGVSTATIDLGMGGLTPAQESALRTNLPNAQVTTHTYYPVLGLASSIDSNGNATYYEYDGLNRLKLIKDKDGRIIKTYQYNFRTQ